ncbi:nucleotidyltransferase domain-containing protein [Peribacillus frigoritolerans]|uniref:nucleotidyltransferase domain-containing protein n=1 Tax=Peribacillus frigoritolerans TaxID=450367 RepID=UPI0010593567|nr:nucleotidyltransferase domain-containing protein [Peribacillus frigoritolerans]TDL83164.1 nucleotidyltransferase domain-containing protein [Peribacillus frigoritolerans]
MKDQILEVLKEIEVSHQVKILYACESGSRAWGFPSKDSDYDVRFIYIHKPEHYLSIDPVGVGSNRDVIERPINDILDVSGWDLTKALKLFRKSNPPLMEWMKSPIVYYQAFSTIDKMAALQTEVFTPHSAIYHYLNMAGNNYREYLQGDTVRIKKYFYVLRPILAARWIEQLGDFPPMEFQVLLDKMLQGGLLKDEILTLLKRKISGDELDREPKIDVVNGFLDSEIIRLKEYAKQLNLKNEDPTSKLNIIFRDTLKEVWQAK